jgi:hypothetical protein
MKLLTFATLMGTAAAFLAPAPQMARTQGRVSKCGVSFCPYVFVYRIEDEGRFVPRPDPFLSRGVHDDRAFGRSMPPTLSWVVSSPIHGRAITFHAH